MMFDFTGKTVLITGAVRPALEGMGMDRWIASRTPMRRIGDSTRSSLR
jgi:hypothetical protein